MVQDCLSRWLAMDGDRFVSFIGKNIFLKIHTKQDHPSKIVSQFVYEGQKKLVR